jgi:5'-AMP-activated protein kinase regulatory beta subunit
MGNTATTGAGKPGASSLEPGGRIVGQDHSPRANSVDMTKFDFPAKRPLVYQSSSEYPSDSEHADAQDLKGRARATTIINQGSSIDENALPTVFKWDGGGKEVFITGTFTDWKPIKMCSSHGDFVTIVDIPEGVHEYKYIVDGSETVNSSQQKNESNHTNVIQVKKCDFEVFEALAMDLASNTSKCNANNSSQLSGSPPGDYSQHFPANMRIKGDGTQPATAAAPTSGSGPPILPPHLLQVILNNPNVHSGDSTLLPQPNHVMLNHLYALSIKDGVMVLSCTHRYRKKYVTTLLYKPI